MTKIIWKKEYERDVGAHLEGIWASGLQSMMAERLNVKTNNIPFVIFFVNEENLQIWENKEAFQELKDALLSKNKRDNSFIIKIMGEYGDKMRQISHFWDKEANISKKDLQGYLKLLNDAAKLFSLWYYSITDERTPNKLKEILLGFREEDEFFARNNMFIRNYLISLGVKEELANLVFPEEIINPPSEKVLRERAKGTVSIDGKEFMMDSLKIFDKKNPNYEFEGLDVSVENIKLIKGQIGFPGKIVGRVRIIKNKRQADKLKEGEIIVSPMTTPEFVDIMKKASAFITNEGGVICHAAITARELKKPCIIGTGVATQVLRDGDLIELDANKGIVRIIERA